MKKLFILSIVSLMSLFLLILVGCGDDDGNDNNNNNSSQPANIIFECTPSSGVGTYQVSNDLPGYYWIFTLSMEETNGTGVQIQQMEETMEVEGKTPHTYVYDCEYIESRFQLNSCYLRGHGKAEDPAAGYWMSSLYLESATWVKFAYTLRGIDDNGNYLETSTTFTGTIE